MARKYLHGNYEYSLTSHQQQAVQLWLRMLPEEYRLNSPVWKLLHRLTYAKSWTPEPQHEIAEPQFILPFQEEAQRALDQLMFEKNQDKKVN